MIQEWYILAPLALGVIYIAVVWREHVKLSEAKHKWYEQGRAAATALRQSPPNGVVYQIRSIDDIWRMPRFCIGVWSVQGPVYPPAFRRFVPEPFVPKGDYLKLLSCGEGGQAFFKTPLDARAALLAHLEDRQVEKKNPVVMCFDTTGDEVPCV